MHQYPIAPQYPTLQKFETPAGPMYVPDEYAWMRQTHDPEVIQYIADENELTAAYMDADSLADTLTKRIEALNNSATIHTTPEVHGDRLVWTQRSPGQERSVLIISDANQEPQTLIDPNVIGEDIGISWYSVPQNGEHIVYALQEKGNGLHQVHVRNTRTGEDRHFAATRMMELAWDDQGVGFMYSKSNGGSHGIDDSTACQQLYYHRADGTAEDALLFDAMTRGLGPNAWLSPKSITGTHALADVFYAKTNLKPLLIDLRTAQARQLTGKHEEATHRSFLLDGYLYIYTTYEANNGRILRTPLDQADEPLDQWEQCISEDPDRILRNFSVTKDNFVVEYSHNVASQLELRNRKTGAKTGNIVLPELSGVTRLATSRRSNTFHFKIANYLSAGVIYRYDEHTTIPIWQDNRSLDPQQYEATQEWFTSFDGTAIPVVLVCKRGLLRTAHAKKIILQEQYAGFANGRHPDKGFSTMRRVWLENDGIIAESCNRGGDEFGARWHAAAIGPNKTRSIDDSVACSQYLKTTGVAEKIGISGGSNGGLIALAALLRAPEVIDAGDIRVPLTDMLNYAQYSPSAKRWRPEFGDAQNPKQFNWLVGYSPYHTIKPGVTYNAFFSLGMNDKVVHPAHSLKMVARLQRTGSHILMHVDGAAGHGPDRGASQMARIQGMRLAYLMRELGLYIPADD